MRSQGGYEALMTDILHSVIPTVLDSSSRGDRAFDIYSMLLKERIVFLGQEVDDQIANLLVAEILYLEAQDPDKDINLYINSPGGLAYAGMAIYDVMQHVRPDVSTICIGMGLSAAAMILCGGATGKRLALPSAKIMIHQGSAGTRGAPRDMEIHLREVLATTRRMAEIIAFHSGKPADDGGRRSAGPGAAGLERRRLLFDGRSGGRPTFRQWAARRLLARALDLEVAARPPHEQGRQRGQDEDHHPQGVGDGRDTDAEL